MLFDKVAAAASTASRRDRLHGQFLRFVLVGGLSTVLDGLTYRMLLLADFDTNTAKALGYLVGMTCSILCNYRWTFGHGTGNRTGVIVRCVLLYATALVVNVAANHVALALLPIVGLTAKAAAILAFLFAVGVSTVYNFAGMRFWIFRKDAPPVPIA